MKHVALGSVVLLALAGAARADELVVNGGFESGFAGWSIALASSAPGLTLSSAAHTGSASAAFIAGGLEDDQIFQTLPTVAGRQYQVSFWIRNVDSDDDHFRASWEGVALLDQGRFPFVNPFQQITFTVTATTNGSELRFGGYDTLSTLLLDDVSVNTLAAAVPLPASAWIGMGGLAGVAGLGAIRRRRGG